MRRNLTSFFFLFTFTLLICAPAMLYMANKQHEVILIADITEEENKENKNSEKLEIKLISDEKLSTSFLNNEGNKEFHFKDLLYSELHKEDVSPPPEHL